MPRAQRRSVVAVDGIRTATDAAVAATAALIAMRSDCGAYSFGASRLRRRSACSTRRGCLSRFFGRPVEVLLHQHASRSRRARWRSGLATPGMRDDREVLRVELHRVLARRPVGQLLRGRPASWCPYDAEGLEVPAQAFLREHQVDRRALAPCSCWRGTRTRCRPTNSPAPAMLHGLEPECVYCAMFSCSASMYFQPSLPSPHS